MRLVKPNYQGLTFKQQQAIELIAKGKTDTEVGNAVGVRRGTVNHWRHHHPAFKKALEAYKALLTIYAYGGRSEQAFQVFKLLKTHLPPNDFPSVIDFLKLETTLTEDAL